MPRRIISSLEGQGPREDSIEMILNRLYKYRGKEGFRGNT